MASATIFFSFLIFSCLALCSPATCSTNQTDLLALLSFKAAIDSDPNGVLNSWNETTTSFCSWKGIRCGRRHPDRVVGIDLQSQGLSGSLSPHIGNLSFLRGIILQNNSFHGQIPQEIGLLRRLEFVVLSNNSFSGIIPRNLSQCKNLLNLDLIDNLFGVIPPELGFLYKLVTLGLAKNKLSGTIPQSIGNVTSLRGISLAYCGLIGGIPKSLAQLHRLEFLQLGSNNLTGSIPLGIFNISTIFYFGVGSNRLEGTIPSTIGLTLPNLQYIILFENRFSGHIPVSLSNTSSLEIMDFEYNYFTGSLPRFEELSQLKWVQVAGNSIEGDISFIISSMTNCTNLQLLSLGGNIFSGSMPETIANLSRHLQHLSIFSSPVHGKVPSGIGNLLGLTVLQISETNLEGPIPSGIGRLTNLQYLNLRGNRLTNVLPSSFGNLSLLSKLHLGGNNFSGVIPKGFGSFTNLVVLNISHNNFNGPMPQEIMSLSSISIYLDLSHNAFTGSIPVEVGSLGSLASLDLSNNKLSGVIPNSFKKCLGLQQLYLQGNFFGGLIPHALSSLMGVENLDLSRNNLSGPIPSFFAKMHLQKLNLSFNRLQGEVPALGVFKNKSAISLEGNEELCGGILELNLPPCPSSNFSKKKYLATLLKILIPIAGFAALLCLVIFLYKIRKPRESLSSLPSFIGKQFLRLSYADVLRATSGFAEANLAGVGRFASVYKGILEDGQTLVAVKVLNLVVKGASKSFMAECNALRGIRHRNLVKILSVCESIDFQGNDFKALVYEFKANGSLEKWLHNNTQQEGGEPNSEMISSLDMIQRLDISIDVAEALEYLHNGTDSTIVHGDLKPSNILLDENMSACVCDFGLAKIISDTLQPLHERSSTIGITGTVGYVPPEYGTNNSISTKGDTYIYGILLLEIFTNRRPTDDSFEDHVNLHSFVSAALPDRVMEIVDPLIQIGPRMNNRKTKDCMASILNIGVSCSKETSRDRISMIEVVNELRKIKEYYVAGD